MFRHLLTSLVAKAGRLEGRATRLRAGDTAVPLAFADAAVEVSALLGQAK
ncbi:MAG: hypothetical protein KJ072_11020 [Verrucomicrobia bacterium]|nr:hypothetical protein [Verrucomicrobiota bacterium]